MTTHRGPGNVMFLSRGTMTNGGCVSKEEEEGDCQCVAHCLCLDMDNLVSCHLFASTQLGCCGLAGRGWPLAMVPQKWFVGLAGALTPCPRASHTSPTLAAALCLPSLSPLCPLSSFCLSSPQNQRGGGSHSHSSETSSDGLPFMVLATL